MFFIVLMLNLTYIGVLVEIAIVVIPSTGSWRKNAPEIRIGIFLIPCLIIPHTSVRPGPLSRRVCCTTYSANPDEKVTWQQIQNEIILCSRMYWGQMATKAGTTCFGIIPIKFRRLFYVAMVVELSPASRTFKWVWFRWWSFFRCCGGSGAVMLADRCNNSMLLNIISWTAAGLPPKGIAL